MLSVRPHPTPFFGSVPCRAPPDTAHSPIFWGGAAFAEGSWQALESPEVDRSNVERISKAMKNPDVHDKPIPNLRLKRERELILFQGEDDMLALTASTHQG